MSHSEGTPFEYTLEERENVVILDLTDWSGETEGMNKAERDWLTRASQPQITAVVTEFSADMSLGREAQTHLAKEWSENGHDANIDKLAFVSEGVKSQTASANPDVPQKTKAFSSVDKAIEWARQ